MQAKQAAQKPESSPTEEGASQKKEDASSTTNDASKGGSNQAQSVFSLKKGSGNEGSTKRANAAELRAQKGINLTFIPYPCPLSLVLVLVLTLVSFKQT